MIKNSNKLKSVPYDKKKMTALTVWKFDTANGAQEALNKLVPLQKEHIIEIRDAATVSWPEGKKKPKTTQAINLVGIGALDGAFWGLLFGLLFFCPIFGIAVGAGMGALGGSLRDYGINDDFIKDVRSKVTEGTSALFLLTGDVTVDKVEEALGGITGELIQSNLSNEEEEKLKEHFSPEV
ncbi:putative UCP014873 [Crocosphaera subtropica ATCC 51142]|uniref:UCP014873 n=2 Tax=Crocosphaera TaxID=263510 RepID=B1WS29_CROS5|nr:putative UCP014873 [Crocosphaera subtropica ATCC 51142]